MGYTSLALDSQLLRFGEFELDPARYELRKRGRRVKLQRIPMELLLVLAQRPGALAPDIIKAFTKGHTP